MKPSTRSLIAPTIAEQLRAARVEAGLSQTALSVRAGVSVPTIALLERGLASQHTVRRIRRVLRLPADALATREDAP